MLNHEDIRRAIREGEEARQPFEPTWAECDNFFAGEQTLARTPDNRLVDLDRLIQLRPDLQRLRQVYNMITRRAMGALSSYTALQAAIQIDAIPPVGAQSADTASQSAAAAAVAAERLAEHLRETLGLRADGARARLLAITLGEGYALPTFDPTKGDPISDTGKYTGMCSNQIIDPAHVGWSGGMRFEESPDHFIETFYTKDEFTAKWPEHAKKVKENAVQQASLSHALLDRGHGNANLISVYEYFKRPSPTLPKGYFAALTNDLLLEEGDYPWDFPETNAEPWLVRYFYIQPERKSRAIGMVQQLLDPQRAYNRRQNLLTEWINFGAQPGVEIPQTLEDRQKIVMKPGMKVMVNPALGETVKFIQPANPPQALMQAPRDLEEKMDSISGQYDYTRLAGSSAAASIKEITQQNQAFQGEIARGFDEADAKVIRRHLLLSRKFYTEPRDVRYKSHTGDAHTEMVASRELPRTINLRITQAPQRSQQDIAALAADWGTRGWVPPAKAMLAIEAGSLDIITEAFKLDVDKAQRANAEIAALDPRQTEELIRGFAQASAEFQAAGGDATQASPPPGPWPHASEDDNQDIAMEVMKNWFKTREFSLLPKPIQQVARWKYQEHEMLKVQAAQRQQMLDAAQAQALGAENAAKTGEPAQMPNVPKPPVDSNQQQAA